MKNFFNWLGMKYHNHKWVIYEEMAYTKIVRGWHPKEKSGVRIILKCEICGEIKYKDV